MIDRLSTLSRVARAVYDVAGVLKASVDQADIDAAMLELGRMTWNLSHAILDALEQAEPNGGAESGANYSAVSD